jgi:signal transduction histidine kinase
MNETQKSYLLKSAFYSLVSISTILLLFFLLLDIATNDFLIISAFIILGSIASILFNFKFINEILDDRYRKKRRFKNKMESKIRIKNRQRNDMISAIAHEFRNPISVIMGYAQTLNDDSDIDIKLRTKFLSKIYDNSQKIETVLVRLILWNKFESKSAKLETTNFSIKELVEEIVLSLKEKYINRNIMINSDDSMVNADRLLIGIVIQNIIENGLKYSSLDVIVDIADKQVVVSDKGVGINDTDIALITKKFYRSGTHDWDNSMGIGLSIVKQILKLHHSELKITSNIGDGSSFSFDLKDKFLSDNIEV